MNAVRLLSLGPASVDQQGIESRAVIAEIAADSPAEKAGLRKGDIVTGADDRPIRTAAQLRNTIGLARIGEDVKLTLLRKGAPLTATVRVAPAIEPSGALAGPNRLVR
ncbi:PDZ domain-containing protein [Bradyrhizobium liaoningense]